MSDNLLNRVTLHDTLHVVLYYRLVYFISEYGLCYCSQETIKICNKQISMVVSLWYQLNSVKTAVHELGTEEKRLRWRGKLGGGVGEVRGRGGGSAGGGEWKGYRISWPTK
jgi:hypothetical protein